MASGINEQTERTLRHHWQAFRAGDVDAIMADYAEDAVLITRDATLKGQAQIRLLFSQISEDIFPPDSTSLNLTNQVVEGEIAYILWSANSARYNAPFCTDTFLIHDGKIVAQTFAAQMEPK